MPDTTTVSPVLSPLQDVLQHVRRRPLRVQLRQVRAELLPLPLELVAADARRHREHLLAVGETPPALSLRFGDRRRQVLETPLGPRADVLEQIILRLHRVFRQVQLG